MLFPASLDKSESSSSSSMQCALQPSTPNKPSIITQVASSALSGASPLSSAWSTLRSVAIATTTLAGCIPAWLGRVPTNSGSDPVINQEWNESVILSFGRGINGQIKSDGNGTLIPADGLYWLPAHFLGTTLAQTVGVIRNTLEARAQMFQEQHQTLKDSSSTDQQNMRRLHDSLDTEMNLFDQLRKIHLTYSLRYVDEPHHDGVRLLANLVHIYEDTVKNHCREYLDHVESEALMKPPTLPHQDKGKGKA